MQNSEPLNYIQSQPRFDYIRCDKELWKVKTSRSIGIKYICILQLYFACLTKQTYNADIIEIRAQFEAKVSLV